jgi:hypothetical protein
VLQPLFPTYYFIQPIRWRADRFLQPTATDRSPDDAIVGRVFNLRDISFLKRAKKRRPESSTSKQKLKVRSVNEEQQDENTWRPWLFNGIPWLEVQPE